MTEFFRSRVRSFQYAFAGWWYVIRTQRNAWIHGLATVLVAAVAIWLQVSLSNLAVLVLTIGAVWTAEFMNTALESIVDLASPEQHPLAKAGKDVGAAAVLIAAGCAVLVGVLILGPPLWQRLQLLLR